MDGTEVDQVDELSKLLTQTITERVSALRNLTHGAPNYHERHTAEEDLLAYCRIANDVVFASCMKRLDEMKALMEQYYPAVNASDPESAGEAQAADDSADAAAESEQAQA